MAAMLVTMVTVWLLLLAAPATPVARYLHAILVAAPAARLNRLTRGHVAAVVLLGIVIGMVAWVGEGDGLRMLAMAAPETATWLTTFEIAAYLDVAVAAIAAWSAARLRLPALMPGRIAMPRRRRAPRPSRIAANDDGEEDQRRCA